MEYCLNRGRPRHVLNLGLNICDAVCCLNFFASFVKPKFYDAYHLFNMVLGLMFFKFCKKNLFDIMGGILN